VKTICAWCGIIIGYKCPYCGEPLRLVQSPSGSGKVLLCDAGLSNIYFTDTSHMASTHTVCSECSDRFRAGLGPREIIQLSAEDRANLFCIDKKRGPTGVSADANTPNPDAAKADGVGHQTPPRAEKEHQ